MATLEVCNISVRWMESLRKIISVSISKALLFFLYILVLFKILSVDKILLQLVQNFIEY